MAPRLSVRLAILLLCSRTGLSVWIIILSCAALETGLSAAELGWIGQGYWRNLVVQYAGFWPGLLHGWQPNYEQQPVTMFLTYAFIHADFWHMAGNMLLLPVLMSAVINRLGLYGAWLVYFVSTLSGAVMFALCSAGSQPMVGASGGLSGLIGAWQLWHWQIAQGSERWNVIMIFGLLVLVNGLMEFGVTGL